MYRKLKSVVLGAKGAKEACGSTNWLFLQYNRDAVTSISTFGMGRKNSKGPSYGVRVTTIRLLKWPDHHNIRGSSFVSCCSILAFFSGEGTMG